MTVEATEQARPAYEPPAIIYEADLEVRAGSPLGIPDPLGDLGDPN
jgi:hypothetical protein